ncbi:FtsW/RodA/SpoVE family cell cycle protein [Conexibacter sp. DBS9H8]|uniref:FtsW/RodA/SpoVE family cell cycle protein n=1 Tax=Conexibacter sp. DBS9H8 TaxID=2937801 RepID=UPI00200F35BC|nr:FtsW/RodA/SpoVE family cell cycle protein [Conexibacter sp. DBS9H8]
MRARNRELFGLIPAALLMTAGLAAVLVQESNRLSNTSLIYGGVFLGLCLVGNIFIRITLPHADPYLFPLVSVLACFGLVMVLRIYGVTYARQQAQWFVLGLILVAVAVLVFRDYRKLERYRYLIAVGSILFMVLPRVPGLEDPVNGAYLAIKLGPFTFQPTEFGKVGLIVFLASYLRDHRQVLAQGTTVLGVRVGLPPLRHLGPMLLLWGIAMLILIFLHDVGTSLMFYGALLAMLYVGTGRVSFVVLGLLAFAVGSWYLATHIAHIDARVLDWEHPFRPALYDAYGGSQQLADAQFNMAAGGLFGQGFGQSIITIPGTQDFWLPAPGTDMIYAVIVSELGLFGGVGLLAVYILICWRGFKAATLARDSFSKLLATGLSAVLALQVFVIVGGVTRVIPLTGVTLPFVSYGGSSILANFILVALLLLVSDRARRQALGAMTP